MQLKSFIDLRTFLTQISFQLHKVQSEVCGTCLLTLEELSLHHLLKLDWKYLHCHISFTSLSCCGFYCFFLLSFFPGQFKDFSIRSSIWSLGFYQLISRAHIVILSFHFSLCLFSLPVSCLISVCEGYIKKSYHYGRLPGILVCVRTKDTNGDPASLLHISFDTCRHIHYTQHIYTLRTRVQQSVWSQQTYLERIGLYFLSLVDKCFSSYLPLRHLNAPLSLCFITVIALNSTTIWCDILQTRHDVHWIDDTFYTDFKTVQVSFHNVLTSAETYGCLEGGKRLINLFLNL